VGAPLPAGPARDAAPAGRAVRDGSGFVSGMCVYYRHQISVFRARGGLALLIRSATRKRRVQ
jgi:hypothetical protein